LSHREVAKGAADRICRAVINRGEDGAIVSFLVRDWLEIKLRAGLDCYSSGYYP